MMRGEAKVTLLQAYGISLPCRYQAVNMHCFYEYFFGFMFHFVCDGWQNWAMCLLQVLLDKSATETLEMLCEAFGEHSLNRTVVYEWHSCFKASWVSVEDYKFRPTKHQKNNRKCLKKFENSSTKTIIKQSMSLQTLAGLSPLWFRLVSQIENETEGMKFWNSVWHPKRITSITRQH
jgi:hypothetical protein